MTRQDMIEMELTEQDIVHGSAYRKKLILKSDNPTYDGKMVTYRTLKGDEFAKAMEKIGMDESPTLAENLRFLIEVGKIPGVLSDGIAKKYHELDQDVIAQISGAILGSSKGDEKKVANFSEAPKAK